MKTNEDYLTFLDVTWDGVVILLFVVCIIVLLKIIVKDKPE